jgi:nucleolar protein 56
MKYLFTNIIGSFVLDQKLEIVDSILFKTVKEYKSKDECEERLKSKHTELESVPKEKMYEVLKIFKDKKYYPEFYQKNIILTKECVRQAVADDWLIIQAIANINELDKSTNLLTKRLREWYSLYLPELDQKVGNQENYVELVITKSKEELVKEFSITESMGADLTEQHVEEIVLLAKQIKELQQLRSIHENYLEKIMKKYTPNLLELAGVTIAAKLIELSRSLKRLALLPASTVQLLGAEKALFRHIKTGSRSPKHGVIFQHPLIQTAGHKNQGRAARMLADKLSLCARLDYFKGEFKAPDYRKMLEEKLK